MQLLQQKSVQVQTTTMKCFCGVLVSSASLPVYSIKAQTDAYLFYLYFVTYHDHKFNNVSFSLLYLLEFAQFTFFTIKCLIVQVTTMITMIYPTITCRSIKIQKITIGLLEQHQYHDVPS